MGPSGNVRSLGRYTLYGELASGGMATVHVGRLRGPVGFSRTVAIKSLHPQYAKDPEFVAMFLDEARLAARIRHPNVVPTLDVVALQGELFLVMEYVQGETLARLIRAAREHHERIPPSIASSIVAGALLGLHAAHEATNDRGERLDIVHRDVSPQNIIVGVDGVARMLDFGVAKATERLLETTQEGRIKGKIAYMAPEQLRGAHVNRQTDIYAASVVLWEALTGERLFVGRTEGDVLDGVLLAAIEPPSKWAKGLPSGLDAVVMQGLARERSQRFSTAREMAIALQTCGVAPATEVGEWVEARADEVLTHRATWIARIESETTGGFTDANRLLSTVGDSSSGEAPSPDAAQALLADTSATTSQVHRPSEHATAKRSRIGMSLLLTGIAIVGLAIVWGFRAGTGPTASAHSLASAPEPSASVLPTPDPDRLPLGASGVPESIPLSEAQASPLPSLSKPRTMPGTKGDCTPPYTLSPSGRKTYKRNCL
jgi:serine/threonine protein kinase